ncbi:MAG: MFS transporter [Dysgonamonadaceae bacterium]|nr:MFS transporter [Dysgonamonadaceae bacterium]
MQETKSKFKVVLLSIPIVLGIFTGYVFQFSPTPLMHRIAESFSLFRPDGTLDLVTLNTAESIIFPFIILSSIFGVFVDQKFKTRNMYTMTLSMLAAGILLSGFAPKFSIFLIGRGIYGVGFGLSVVFIGSAIVQWYTPKQSDIMFTITGLFPFSGTAVAFSALVPMSVSLNNSWKNVLMLLGCVCILMLVFWLFCSKKLIRTTGDAVHQSEKLRDVYGFLLKNNTIRFLGILFASDFFFYAFIGGVLVVFFQITGDMNETSAGLWAAVAFPGISFFGGITSGWVMVKTGLKKPAIFSAQFIKLIGVVTIFAGGVSSVFPVIIVGVFFYGIGDGMVPPAMYSMIAGLDNMTPSRVGAGLSVVLSAGFISGIISPIFGAWLSNLIADGSNIVNPMDAQAHGLTYSLFLIGIVSCLVCLVFSIPIKETGKKRNG